MLIFVSLIFAIVAYTLSFFFMLAAFTCRNLRSSANASHSPSSCRTLLRTPCALPQCAPNGLPPIATCQSRRRRFALYLYIICWTASEWAGLFISCLPNRGSNTFHAGRRRRVARPPAVNNSGRCALRAIDIDAIAIATFASARKSRHFAAHAAALASAAILAQAAIFTFMPSGTIRA